MEVTLKIGDEGGALENAEGTEELVERCVLGSVD